MQTITTKEDLYKAFVVFNNSGPDSPFGVHKFEVLSYDGDRCPRQHAQTRKGPTPGEFPEQVYRRYADNIFLGADFDRSEEQTSDLQSLMRLSYVVFCSTKKQQYTLEHYMYT